MLFCCDEIVCFFIEEHAPHEKPCSQTKGGLQFLTPADTKVTQFLLNLLDPMENYTNIPLPITLQILECPKGTQYSYFFQAGFFPSTVGSVKHVALHIVGDWRTCEAF